MVQKKDGDVSRCEITYSLVARVKDLGFSLTKKSLNNLNNFYLAVSHMEKCT